MTFEEWWKDWEKFITKYDSRHDAANIVWDCALKEAEKIIANLRCGEKEEGKW